MSGVYTNIARKRVEQSNEAALTQAVSQVEQKDQNTSLPIRTVEKKGEVRVKKNVTHSPAPANEKKNTKNLADGKTQISAVVTYEQKAVMLDLESKFNRRNKVVGKGDIAGIGLDVVSRILSRPTPLFSSLEEIKTYINKVIDKALET